MTKLWFSYSIGGKTLDTSEVINSPFTITWNLGRFLRERATENGWEFEYRELDDLSEANVSPDDIVIGHTWFSGGFMDVAWRHNPRLYFIIQPYSNQMVSEPDLPRMCSLFDRADHLFLITGQYWFDAMEKSPYAYLKGNATRLDMAVNPALFPVFKRTFNPKGSRRLLAIGNTIPAKGMDLVADLARMGGYVLGHYGFMDHPEVFAHVPHFRPHGGVTFNHETVADICKEYDFFITMGRYDANPTTLLETSLWGLPALCTETSGYYAEQPFLGLSLDDPVSNLEMIDMMQSMDEYDLRKYVDGVRQEIVVNHNWEKFCNTVWEGMKARL